MGGGAFDARTKKWHLGISVYFLDSRAGVAWHIYDILSPGHVLTIYCWDSTFKDIMAKYYPAYNPETEMIGDVEVHWIIQPHEDNVYLNVAEDSLPL